MYIYRYIDILWYIYIYIYIYIHTYIVIFAYPQHMSTPFQAFRSFRARLRTLQRLSRRGCPLWPSPACWATQRLRKSDGKHMEIHRGKHGKWWKMIIAMWIIVDLWLFSSGKMIYAWWIFEIYVSEQCTGGRSMNVIDESINYPPVIKRGNGKSRVKKWVSH